MPFLGQKRYCFVAIDCVGKAIAVKISSTPSSAQNSLLIEQIKQTFPFSIKCWRNDNGGENLKDFHKSLEKAEISQYFTHPSCPKDKPFVERVIGTIEREAKKGTQPFYSCSTLIDVFNSKRVKSFVDKF